MICSICNNNNFYLIYSKDYNRRLNNRIIKYKLCKNCKTLFNVEENIDLDKAYLNSFDPKSLSKQKFNKIKNKNKYFFKLFSNYNIDGPLLEIGPGNGYFLSILKENNFFVDVVEQNVVLCNFYENSLGINKNNIFCIDFNHFNSDNKYKAIFAWQVIEHLVDIDNWLNKMNYILDKDGYLFLSTPNIKSFQFKIMKKYWPHLDAPRHQTIFNTESLNKKLIKHNFKLVKVKWSIDSILWNRFGWINFFKNFFNFKNDYLPKILGYLFFFIFLPIELFPGLSSSFIAVYKKNV